MLGDYLRGLFVRGFSYPSRLRASRLLEALGELRNTFEVLHFLAFPLFFFFSLSFFLHYLRMKDALFLVLLPGFFLLDLALLLNYATRGQGRGARRAGLVLLGVLALGLVSCILLLWVERPIRLLAGVVR